VLKKIDWMVWLGAIIMLAGGLYFWFYFRAHAPSPFDMVESQEQFIPILVQVSGTEGEESAPTLESMSPDPGLEQEALGIDTLKDGRIPERLVIPSIYLDAPIVAVHYKDIEAGGEVYQQWRVPAEFSAGWQDESALLGLPGNTVLNGHHNAYGMVFKDLVKLTEGDLILVHSGGVEFRYLVAAKMLLPERGQTLETRMQNARWLAASEDERLTLVTCWPADSNTHRVIVVAYPEQISTD
jgi:sortase A